MKVKELLAKLKACGPEEDVLCYCEDKELVRPKQGFRIFEISSVERTDAQQVRGRDGIPSLKLGKSDDSAPHVLIEVITDF